VYALFYATASATPGTDPALALMYGDADMATYYDAFLAPEIAGLVPRSAQINVFYRFGPDEIEDVAIVRARTFEVSAIDVSSVPEPGTWALVGLGLVGVTGLARRRARPRAAPPA
jgi:hypothetical protein